MPNLCSDNRQLRARPPVELACSTNVNLLLGGEVAHPPPPTGTDATHKTSEELSRAQRATQLKKKKKTKRKYMNI